MLTPMPIIDDRTDVLKNMISKRLTAPELPTVTRELANVVIGMSGDVFELMRILKGNNGSGGGLLKQVDDLQRDIKTVLNKLEETKAVANQAEQKAENATENATKDTPFAGFVKWLVDNVLPSLLSWAILGLIALGIATWLHLRIEQGVP